MSDGVVVRVANRRNANPVTVIDLGVKEVVVVGTLRGILPTLRKISMFP